MPNVSVSYETRRERLAGEFADTLDAAEQSPKGLNALSDKLDAEVRLADFKTKFRQADHVKWLSYGPVAISVVLAFAGVFGWQQKNEEAKTTLIFKVLDAKPPSDELYLKFFVDSGMLKRNDPEEMTLETLVDRRQTL